MRLGAAILIAALLAAVIVVGAGGERPRDGSATAPRGGDKRVHEHTLLARAPFMGVACPRANSIACDRVGLAVWLREKASAVSAEIDGRRFRLEQWDGWPRSFVGYLRPAGLRDGELRVPVRGSRWLGYGDVSARVRLWVTGGGSTRVTEVEVPLRAGWG